MNSWCPMFHLWQWKAEEIEEQQSLGKAGWGQGIGPEHGKTSRGGKSTCKASFCSLPYHRNDGYILDHLADVKSQGRLRCWNTASEKEQQNATWEELADVQKIGYMILNEKKTVTLQLFFSCASCLTNMLLGLGRIILLLGPFLPDVPVDILRFSVPPLSRQKTNLQISPMPLLHAHSIPCSPRGIFHRICSVVKTTDGCQKKDKPKQTNNIAQTAWMQFI